MSQQIPSPSSPTADTARAPRDSDEILALKDKYGPVATKDMALQDRLLLQNEWIETSTGGKFELAKPVFSIEDIAHALSMCCRFNGHVSQFYSVAEHSVLVSLLMDRFYGGDPFEGLMHDALEAYLVDVPSPIKRLLPDYKELDAHLDKQLRAHFGVTPEKTKECKHADRIALFVEAYYLIPSKGANYFDPDGDRAEALKLINETGIHVSCLEPNYGRAMFMTVFEKLNPNKSRIIVP
jgi:hypothetical protein